MTIPPTAHLSPPELVLLDRDGVINFDSPDYIKSPEEWRPLPGALRAIARLNNAGILVGVCSNQSGLGRGLFDAQTLAAIHKKLVGSLAKQGGHLDHLGICPHTPEADCECRKPRPGMLIGALRQCHTDAAATLFVGDSMRDLEAAEAAGVRGVLVRTGNGRATEEMLRSKRRTGTAVFDDLACLVDALLTPAVTEASGSLQP